MGLNEFHTDTKSWLAICNKKVPFLPFIIAVLTRLALQQQWFISSFLCAKHNADLYVYNLSNLYNKQIR